MQELYACIRDSVETAYLEPNGISPGDFVWPKKMSGNVTDPEELAWYYLVFIYNRYALYGTLYDVADFPYNMPSESNQNLMNAVFNGILTWYQSPENSSVSLIKLSTRVRAFSESIPANVDFSAE